MKFSIRFADKIVGAFIILALGILVFVMFMLGKNQRWFARDYQYITYLSSAAGVSPNMPVQFRGFTIGRVKGLSLANDDRVEVKFVIFDTYYDRVKEGTLVDIIVSPIGLGNQFMFYPGLGTQQLPEGSVIYNVNSAEGRQLVTARLAAIPVQEDGISAIMNNVNKILSDVETITYGLTDLPDTINNTINELRAQIDPILKDINDITGGVADPDGTVMGILDGEGPIYNDLIASINSITGILKNLETTTDFIPSQLPNVAYIMSNLQTLLRQVEDILVSLSNNPLIRGGIPQQNEETGLGGTRPRNIEF